MRGDFHIHTTVSDGSDTIADIIKAAVACKLDAISITDHDTLSHITQMPQDAPVLIIPGLEISAVDHSKGMRAHILGYRICEAKPIERLTRPILEARHQNTLHQISILKEHGYNIDTALLQSADGKYLYKQHVMDYLVSTGQTDEMFGAFYQQTFKNNGICHFDIAYPDATEAVVAIKKAGGVAVLAHSGQQQNFYIIPELVRYGLDGLELNHHANSAVDRRIIRQYAETYNLFLTGGSDYHGRYEPQNVGIGDIISDESGFVALCS